MLSTPKRSAPVELVEEEKDVSKKLRMDDEAMKESSKKCVSSSEALLNKDKVEIVKAEDMVEKDTALLDSFICGFQRTTTLFFGRIVSNPADLPIFKDWLGYSMTYNNVPSGNGNALHLHNSVEIFVAMDAAFEIGYGPKGENKAVLQPMDFVACPARVYHYYKNVDPSKPANILTILPGRPSVTWAPEVVEQARQKGALCDDTGVLAMKDASMRMDAPQVSEKVFLEGDINPFVMKHANKQALFLQGPEGWIQLGWKDLQCGESVEITGKSPQGPVTTVTKEDHDVLVINLSGSVEVMGPQVGESLQRLDMFKLPRKGWTGMFKGITDSTLLIVRSILPHHFDFFLDPDAGISTTLGKLPSSLMR
eukprot:gnl/MRDRNA2_/MRDRNA2_177333_c0_seq1.p1 gnl/MRDRNA2_/MRDRNA2_177333_c0~~gnl/MRDRNA2_/MRDRNA2_177333_c0_seq1.p1  ORF type:complete len:366 (+),score=63.05 gnl/MRDRNA2_/MRDRNA2_177333_c0_seq1:139-1236(+)